MALSRRVDSILSHQLSRWQETSRALHFRPCIAIANLRGAGGETIGSRVADQLGYGCFGREIVDEIAERRGVAQELMHGLDEGVRSAIERFVTDAFHERRFTESDYLREVAHVVTTLGRRGMAVTIGRGSAFLLGPESALRVLVVAPFSFRLERFARERKLAAKEAEERLRELDARHGEFVRHHFGARLDDPLRFDLVLNSSVLGLEAAADDVVDVYRRRFPKA
jgi:cytidylate kinase